MDWKAHLFIGCLFGAVGGSALGFPAIPLLSFCAIAGVSALLPDLDLRKSKVSQLAYAAGALAIIFAAYSLSGQGEIPSFSDFALFALALGAAALALDLLIRPSHRGVMHGLAFLAALSLISWLLLGPFFALALFLGYFSHLIADLCLKI